MSRKHVILALVAILAVTLGASIAAQKPTSAQVAKRILMESGIAALGHSIFKSNLTEENLRKTIEQATEKGEKQYTEAQKAAFIQAAATITTDEYANTLAAGLAKQLTEEELEEIRVAMQSEALKKYLRLTIGSPKAMQGAFGFAVGAKGREAAENAK